MTRPAGLSVGGSKAPPPLPAGTGAPPPAAATPAAPLTPEEKAEKMSRIRAKVAAEILSTEQSYVESLTVLCDLFYEPAKQILSPEEVQGLFSNIAVIASFNKTFLAELQKRVGAWTNDSEIADLFDKYAQFLKVRSRLRLRLRFRGGAVRDGRVQQDTRRRWQSRTGQGTVRHGRARYGRAG